VQNYTDMSTREKKQVDKEFTNFFKRHFVNPKNCNNLEQIRFYVREIGLVIEDFKRRFNYVPSNAYTILSEFNQIQNKMIFTNFKNTYL